MPVVGIPRALHAFHHYAGWRAFLQELGCEVMPSAATSRATVAIGVEVAPAELCLPVKAFLGHVRQLSQDVDYLLLPRIVCRRVGPDCYFGCPKAIALPDLVRAVMPDIRGAVELLVDDRVLGRSAGMRSVAQALGRQHLWRTALRRASEAQRTADDETRRRGNPLHMFGDSGPPTPNPGVGCRVGIVGHPYLLYDRLLSLDLLNRLGATGAEPVVPWGDGPPRDRTASKAGLPNWLYEADLIQGARALLAGGAVDGLLLVSSFACGTAAVANEVIAREAMRVSTVPVLTVLLDEHTGEAALATRLESFVEVLQRAHT